MATGQFDDKKCAELDEKCLALRHRFIEEHYKLVDDELAVDAAETYKTLMIETIPILYEAWKKGTKTIDRSVAKLTATLNTLFTPLVNHRGVFLGPEVLEKCCSFHECFLVALIYNETLFIDEKGNIVIDDEGSKHIFNSKTFDYEEIVLPPTHTKIGHREFKGFHSLKKMNIPATVQSIGVAAFDDCSELLEITFPDKLSGCSRKETFVSKDGTPILKDTYYNPIGRCYALRNVIVGEDNINYCFEGGLLLSKDKRVLYACINAVESEVFTIPESVSEIAAYAFSGNDHIKTVVCNKTMLYISAYAFARNESIRSVQFGENITAIHQGAFAESAIENLSIPSSVRFIGQEAFSRCTKLKELHIPSHLANGDEFLWLNSKPKIIIDK